LHRSTYHADNEYCLFSDMEKGFRILLGVISQLEDGDAQ
jgi:acetylornithine deacetylase